MFLSKMVAYLFMVSLCPNAKASTSLRVQQESSTRRASHDHIFKESCPDLDHRSDLHKIGRAPQEQQHDVMFSVQLQNMAKLTQILHDVSNPKSDNYGNYMTKQEVVDLVSNPAANEYIRSYLANIGATIIEETDGGDFITARGSVELWEETFDTEFYAYHHYKYDNSKPSTILRAEEYSIPSALHKHVSAVFYTVQMPMIINQGTIRTMNSNLDAHNIASANYPGTITPDVLTAYYNVDTTVGTSSSTQAVYQSLTQYYSPTDLAQFQNQFNKPSSPVINIGNRNKDAACMANPADCIEGNLDIQYIMAISQVSPTTFFWVDPSRSFSSFLSQVSSMAAPPLVISISYVADENTVSSSEFDAFLYLAVNLGARGVTLVAAAGDDGAQSYLARSTQRGQAACGYMAQFPASCPYVVAVGATMGVESGSPEVVCQSNLGGAITSGGGFSKNYGQMSYQTSQVNGYFKIVNGTSQQPVAGYKLGNQIGRGYPDVTLAGASYVTIMNGKPILLAGTSASAPVFAGMLSTINAALIDSGLPPVGFVNPALYAGMALFGNDITSGINNCASHATYSPCCTQGFYATPGWDPTSGIGSVDYRKLKDYFYSLHNGPIRYSVKQVLRGINVTTGSTRAFGRAFGTCVSRIFNITSSSVRISAIKPASTRRHLSSSDSLSSVPNLMESAATGISLDFTVAVAKTNISSVNAKLVNNKDKLSTCLALTGYTSVVVVLSTANTFGPTAAPTSSPVATLGVKSFIVPSCFAASETVLLQSGEYKAISKVKVGDIILASDSVGNQKYSPVVFIPHKPNNIATLFTHLHTKNRDIKVTSNHIIPAGDCSGKASLPLLYAHQVSIGDCVQTINGLEEISLIETSVSSGVYTVVTNEEYLVVNGIIASPFGANHMMANLYYNIHRLLFMLKPTLSSSSFLNNIHEELGLLIPLFGSTYTPLHI